MVQYQLLIQRIIQDQELVVGPIAWIEARKVAGLGVTDEKKGIVTLQGDGKKVLENLVKQYDQLFGLASREVCKSAIVDLAASITKDDLPDILL